MEGSMTAQFARSAVGHKVIGWTKNLKIVDVIENGHSLALQFPEN
jgi:hypothetical protein